MFQPIEQTPRYKLVAQQIAKLILAGKLPRGSKMPTERELVQELGVSRPTIREAMIALEITGFVENSFGSAAFVSKAPPNSSQLTDINQPGPFELLEARIMLEGEVAFLAAKQITRSEIKHLRKCVDQMQTKDPEEFWRADEEFHVSIASASRNLVFANIVRDFWRQRTHMPMCVKMSERVSVDDHRDEIVEMHLRIINALKAEDAEKARNEIRSHLGDFGRALLDRWDDLEDELRCQLSPPAERLIKQLT